jgi:hypothetical protein
MAAKIPQALNSAQLEFQNESRLCLPSVSMFRYLHLATVVKNLPTKELQKKAGQPKELEKKKKKKKRNNL